MTVVKDYCFNQWKEKKMFNKTVADIVKPLSKMSKQLREHATQMTSEISNHQDTVANIESKIVVCNTELTAASKLAEKFEALLSSDD
jgi:uncharacterized protein YoxC